MWSRESPSHVLDCVRFLCPYRGKPASWEQKGYIRRENQSGNVCKENTQELWSQSPASAQRPILTGELVLFSHGVIGYSKLAWTLVKAEVRISSNMHRSKWQASSSCELTAWGHHGFLAVCMCIRKNQGFL